MSEMDDAKRRKTEEQNTGQKQEDAEMKEEAVETTDFKELEEDARPSKAALVQHDIQVETRDATLNVIPALSGRVLMPLTDGGLQYLIAGARANLGIKKGRYLFEVRIVEAHNPSEPANSRNNNRPSGPRQLVRIGLSTQGSSLFLGETEDSVCFDSEGFFTADKKRVAASQRFSREHTIGLLLNLDRKSQNADTVSLFRDGERISAPQALPEHLQDKPLFPHVNFKNVTLHLHFGPAALEPLPFTCRTWQEAAKVDAVVANSSTPKDGLFEALFPVGLPDEGTFDWLDMFLEKNPQYTEISDRMIVKWSEQSGLWRPKTSSWKNSNDKPDMNFGIPLMDDFSVRRVLSSIVAAQPRHYIIMEVKSNLINEERQELLRRFCAPPYKKVAMVVMGNPSSDFKDRIHDLILKEKQEILEQEWRKKKEEDDKKKSIELQQKQLAEAKRKAEEQEKGKQEDASVATKAKPEAGSDNKDGNAPQIASEGEGKKQPEEKDTKTESAAKTEKVDVKDEDDQEKKPDDDEEEEEAMPVAELSEEEKKLLFRKKSVTDLTMWVLSNSFPKFSIPEKSEGFDEIRWEWENESTSKEYLTQYILKKKVHCRIEDLQPSDWFRAKWSEWQKVLQEWHNKQSEYKESAKFKENKAAEEAAKKKAVEAEEKPAEPADEQQKDAKVEEKEKESDDIFAVEDVCNVGTGEPLFAKFTFEDWALLSLRLELLLLVHAFKKDASDPERVGIHEMHLPFYYQKYYRKTFNVKYYGVETNGSLVDMVKDTVVIRPSDMVLEPQLSEEMDSFDIFVKLTEESRRERQRRIDAGDETVKLKFSKPDAPPQKGVQQTVPRPYQVTVGAGAPMKGNTGGSKGYYQQRPQQQDKGWYSGGNNKGPYGGKGAVAYSGLPNAAVGGKSYGGQQSYGGGKSYGGGNSYGKGYGK